MSKTYRRLCGALAFALLAWGGSQFSLTVSESTPETLLGDACLRHYWREAFEPPLVALPCAAPDDHDQKHADA